MAPSYKYLISYLIVTIILSLISIIFYFYFYNIPVATTSNKFAKTAADLDSVIKALCSTLIFNTEQPNNIITNFYRPNGQASQYCKQILSK